MVNLKSKHVRFPTSLIGIVSRERRGRRRGLSNKPGKRACEGQVVLPQEARERRNKAFKLPSAPVMFLGQRTVSPLDDRLGQPPRPRNALENAARSD